MSDAPSQDDISTPSGATATAQDASREKEAAPNWLAIKVLLGLTGLAAAVSLWIGDYTNAAIVGAIGAGAGCMARHQLLNQRGESDAASRWKLASYVFYAVPVGYAIYLFVL